MKPVTTSSSSHHTPASHDPSRRLTKRMESLLALLGRVETLADIGTDHALVPAHAVLRDQCQRAWAIDINEDPLRQAAETLRCLGVDDRVRLVRGDGLGPLRDVNVDAVVLAGLSGRTLMAWCDAAPGVIQRLHRLVIQPNSQLAAVRAWAHKNKLWLVDEHILQHGHRFFVTCAFAPNSGLDPAYVSQDLSPDLAYELGPHFIRTQDPTAARYYEQQHKRLSRLVAHGRDEHRALLHTYEVGRKLMPGHCLD